MNQTERRMLEILKELRDEYNVLAIKAEFEAEGSRTDELVQLNEVIFRADMQLYIKIGGCEAVRDLDQCRLLGATGIMAPMIVALCAIGSFAIRKNFFDVVVMICFGLLGFLMRKSGFATAPMVLGLILSDHLESYFRRALILARGDLWGYFLTRPISIVLAIAIIFSFCLPLITKKNKKNKKKAQA